MRLLEGGRVKTAMCCKHALFPAMDTKFQVKHRMKGGWVQASICDNIFFESIVKNTLENP